MRFLLLSPVVVAFLAACSGGVESEDVTDSSENELRALGKDEVIGTLEYGEASPTVDYVQVPRYRAFKFEGLKGDAVYVNVHSDKDARAWLTDSSFKNVARGVEEANSRDESIHATFSKTGTYYIVFRESAYEASKFTVALNGAHPALPDCDPEEGDECTPTKPTSFDWSKLDAFDPKSCDGAGLTPAQAKTYFPAGESSTAVGEFRVFARRRSCNTVTGCGVWGAVEKSATLVTNATWGSTAGYVKLSHLTGGKVSLQVNSSAMFEYHLGTFATLAFDGQTSISGYVTHYPNFADAYFDGTPVGGQAIRRLDQSYEVSHEFATGKNCVRAYANVHGDWLPSPFDKTKYVEVESVIYAHLDPVL